MGQSCMKSPQGNPNQYKKQKCQHCNMQILQVFYIFIKNINHKCCFIKKIE
jgi:hypothetical protein